MSGTATRLTRREQVILFSLRTSHDMDSPAHLPRSFAISEEEELSLIRKRLLELKLIRMDGRKMVLTGLGELYADIASNERSKRYLLLCLAVCILLFSALAYRLLLML